MGEYLNSLCTTRKDRYLSALGAQPNGLARAKIGCSGWGCENCGIFIVHETRIMKNEAGGEKEASHIKKSNDVVGDCILN